MIAHGCAGLQKPWWRLVLDGPELVTHLIPGQFLLVRCADPFAVYLRRPIFPAPLQKGQLELLLRPEPDPGLAWLSTRQPGDEFGGRVRVTAGEDDARSAGVAVGGPLGAGIGWRFSAHRHESNGFRDNPWLGRDDTNGRDETTLRGRFHIEPSDQWDIELALLYADVANGYDAFALDNSYTMLSDDPGRDAQESFGTSIRVESAALAGATFTSITAYADSDIEFGFDADWGNEVSWAPYTYDYVSSSVRQRTTLTQEFRLASTEAGRLGTADWLFGLYAQRLDESLTSINRGEYFDPIFDFSATLDDRLDSDYEATNLALFGQLDVPLAPVTTLGVGLRVERRTTDYADTGGLSEPRRFP